MVTVFWGLTLELPVAAVLLGVDLLLSTLLKRQHVIITELFTVNMWSEQNVYICKQTITTVMVYCKHTITTYTMWTLSFFFLFGPKKTKCVCLGERQVEYQEFPNSSWWTDASHSPSHSLTTLTLPQFGRDVRSHGCQEGAQNRQCLVELFRVGDVLWVSEHIGQYHQLSHSCIKCVPLPKSSSDLQGK